MNRNLLLIASLLTVLVGVILSCGEPTTPETEKHVISTQTLSGASWPLFIGVEGGYFKKYGLDIELTFGRHPAGIAGVSSGDVLAVNMGLDTALAAASKGDKLVLAGSPINIGSFVIIGSKNMNSADELVGKRIAIGRVGDPPYHYTLALFKALGISTDQIEWIPSGGAATRMVTMTRGAADAALLTAPTYYRLVDEGYPILINMADHPNVVVAQAYIFNREVLENRPELAENFMKAVIDATQRFYTDREFAMEAMRRHTSVKDDETLGKVYDDYFSGEKLERVPFVRQAAVDAVVERNSERLPELKDIDFSNMLYEDILEKLADEGYFQEVYGPSINTELADVRAAAAR